LARGSANATKIIRARAREMGVKTIDSAERTPRRDFEALKHFIRRIDRELQTYGEMPQEFFNSMFRHRSEEDPIYMQRDLRTIAERMNALIKFIQTALESKKACIKELAKAGR